MICQILDALCKDIVANYSEANVYPPILRQSNGRLKKDADAARKAKKFHTEIDVTTCNDLKYAEELLKRFIYTMGGAAAVQAWKDKGWGPDEKATTTLTKILTPEEIVKKVDELTVYYKKYFDCNKEEIVVEITAPKWKNANPVTKTVEV